MAITAADIRREVKEKNVTFLRLMFSDILGVMKNVEIPATDEQLDKVLSNKAMFDGSSIEGFVRINESDMYLYPDLDTWTVFPWGDENGAVAGLICDIYTSAGEPFAGDPRGNLKKALRHMEEVGYKSFNLGPEPEFFLFKLDEQGNPTLEVNDKGGYFDLAPTDLADNTRREIVNVLTEMGFDVEASHHEVAVGQHEIDFKYTDVLKACDNIQIFKLVVKTILVNMVFMLHLWRNLNMVLLVAVCTVTCLSSLKKEMHSLIQRIHVVCNCLKMLTTSLVV